MQQEKIVLFEDAVKHRQAGFSGIKVEFDNADTVEIPIAPDDWVCDFCNLLMPVKTNDDELITMVSLNGTHTLCNDCWPRILKQDKSLFKNVSVCQCCEIKDDIHTYLALLDEKIDKWVGWIRFPNKEQAMKWGKFRMEVTNEVSLPLGKIK
jgi:hypothetical protein